MKKLILNQRNNCRSINRLFWNEKIQKYYSQDKNVAQLYFKKFKTNLDKAGDIAHGFIPQCKSRYINYLIAIGLCGKPINKKGRLLLAQIYSWNFYSFANQSIYYTNLCIEKDGINGYLAELNGENYLKIKKYDTAIDYYKTSLKLTNNIYLLKKITLAYRRNKQKEKAISFLKKERKKRLFDFNAQKVIYNELKKIKQNKF